MGINGFDYVNHELVRLWNEAQTVDEKRIIENQLIKLNYTLIKRICKQYMDVSEHNEDMFSVGCLAIIRALKTFKLGKGAKFTSWWSYQIHGEMKEYHRVCIEKPGKIPITGGDKVQIELVPKRNTPAPEYRLNEMLSCRLLTQIERDILIRYYVQELTIDSISTILGITKQKISIIKIRALGKIKKFILFEEKAGFYRRKKKTMINDA